MPYSFVFYPEPTTAQLVLTPDSGGSYSSVPYVHSSGRAGQVCYVNDGTPDQQGALLTITADGYETDEFRGFLRVYADMTARLEVDDRKLKVAVTAPPVPVPVPGSTPLEIINNIYATGQYTLLTKDSCGRFTEACVTAIHTQIENTCGHIKKDPGQNQFNGHAVDALMFLAGQYVGIWDIIQSSASPDAKPAFNFAGPAEPEKWFYPSAPISGAQSQRDVVVVMDTPGGKR